MSAELDVCPFCGSENVIVDKFGASSFCGSCENEQCGALGPDRPTREAAVIAWNTRVRARAP